jgi:probable rRNA maturation factor
LDVAVTDYRGRPASAPGLAAWLKRVAPAAARGQVVIALISDRRIQALNRRFRGKDAVTDVLSFPAHPAPRARRTLPTHLGDLAIAIGRARRQARDAGHSYSQELKVLALHGLLHLIGYDHHHAADRGRMGRLERRLRARGGLRAGLIERAGARAVDRQ